MRKQKMWYICKKWIKIQTQLPMFPICKINIKNMKDSAAYNLLRLALKSGWKVIEKFTNAEKYYNMRENIIKTNSWQQF